MSWAGDWGWSATEDPLSRPQRPEHVHSFSAQARSENAGSQEMAQETTSSQGQLTVLKEEWMGHVYGKDEVSSSLRETQGNHNELRLPSYSITLTMGEELASQMAGTQSTVVRESPNIGPDGDLMKWMRESVDANITSTLPTELHLLADGDSSPDRHLPPQSRCMEPAQIGTETGGKRHFRVAAEDAIEDYWSNGFKFIGNGAMAIIAERWIADAEPKKQSKHPYNAPTESQPDWWPKGLTHTGPQHMGKAILFEFCLCLFKTLRATGYKRGNSIGSADWFLEGVEASGYRLARSHGRANKETFTSIMKNMLKLLRSRQRFERHEIDGSSIVDVKDLPAKPKRSSKKRTTDSESMGTRNTDNARTEECTDLVDVSGAGQSKQKTEHYASEVRASASFSPTVASEQTTLDPYLALAQHNVPSLMYRGQFLQSQRPLEPNTLAVGLPPGRLVAFPSPARRAIFQADIAAQSQWSADATSDGTAYYYLLHNEAWVPYGVIGNNTPIQNPHFYTTTLPQGGTQPPSGMEVQALIDHQRIFNSPLLGLTREDHQLHGISPSYYIDHNLQQ